MQFFAGIIFTVLAEVIAILFFAKWLRKKMDATDEGGLPEPEASLPKTNYALALEDLDGRPYSFASHRHLGKIVFLNFWATWCGPCRAEMPGIQKLYERLKDQVGFSLLSVSLDDEIEAVKAFLAKEEYSFPVLHSKNTREDLPREFATSGIPATFVIGKDGQVLFKHIGSARWDAPSFVDYLRNLLSETPK